MTAEAVKAPPQVSPENAAFWQGCREGRLLIQRCRDCGACQFYPRVCCTVCGGGEMEWHPAKGSGRVRSFTVIRVPVSAAWAEEVPYVVALVTLDEGPTLMTNIVEADPEVLAIGARVTVDFEARGEARVPVFRLLPRPSR